MLSCSQILTCMLTLNLNILNAVRENTSVSLVSNFSIKGKTMCAREDVVEGYEFPYFFLHNSYFSTPFQRCYFF